MTSQKKFEFYKKLVNADDCLIPVSDLLTPESKQFMDENERKLIIKNTIEAKFSTLPKLKLRRQRAVTNAMLDEFDKLNLEKKQ